MKVGWEEVWGWGASRWSQLGAVLHVGPGQSSPARGDGGGWRVLPQPTFLVGPQQLFVLRPWDGSQITAGVFRGDPAPCGDGAFGPFLAFWEMSVKAGMDAGKAGVGLGAGGSCATGGFRLQHAAWILSGLLRICADLPQLLGARTPNLGSASGQCASEKTGPHPQALLASCR